jgi:DNA polymerase III beta subunit, N-terminal domain
MEFSVTKSALLNELTTTQGVIERKITIPILSNLLVEAKGSCLTITATDLELSVRTSCEAKIRKEGAGTRELRAFPQRQLDARRLVLVGLGNPACRILNFRWRYCGPESKWLVDEDRCLRRG